MNDVTRAGSGSLVEVPEMSAPLRGCVDRCRTVSRFTGGEDERSEAALQSEWVEPKWVSEALRDEAARLLPFYDRVSMAVSEQTMLRWLNVLWLSLPKQKNSVGDWAAISVVYCAMLDDFPALCFSKRSMIAARDRFKFFPGTNELAAFLAPYRNEVSNCVYRLRVISKTTTERDNWSPAPEERGRSPEDLQAVGDICAGIRRTLGARPHSPAKPKEAADADTAGS